MVTQDLLANLVADVILNSGVVTENIVMGEEVRKAIPGIVLF